MDWELLGNIFELVGNGVANVLEKTADRLEEQNKLREKVYREFRAMSPQYRAFLEDLFQDSSGLFDNYLWLRSRFPDTTLASWHDLRFWDVDGEFEYGWVAIEPKRKPVVATFTTAMRHTTSKATNSQGDAEAEELEKLSALGELALTLLAPDFSYDVTLINMEVQDGVEIAFIVSQDNPDFFFSMHVGQIETSGYAAASLGEDAKYVLSHCKSQSVGALNDYATALWTRAAQPESGAAGPNPEFYDFREILNYMDCDALEECVQISEDLARDLSRIGHQTYQSTYILKPDFNNKYQVRKRNYRQALRQQSKVQSNQNDKVESPKPAEEQPSFAQIAAMFDVIGKPTDTSNTVHDTPSVALGSADEPKPSAAPALSSIQDESKSTATTISRSTSTTSLLAGKETPLAGGFNAWNISDMIKPAIAYSAEVKAGESIGSLSYPLISTGTKPLTYFADKSFFIFAPQYTDRPEYAFSTIAIASVNIATFCAFISACAGGIAAEDLKWAQSVNTCLQLAQISCAYYLNMSESAVMALPDDLFRRDELKKKLLGISGCESTPEIDGRIESAHASLETPTFFEENNKDNCWAESRKIAKFDYEQWLAYSGLLIVDSLAIEDGSKGRSYSSNDIAAGVAIGNLAAAARKMAQGHGNLPKLPAFDKLAEDLEQSVIRIANDPNFVLPELTRKPTTISKWSLTNSILYDPAKDPALNKTEK